MTVSVSRMPSRDDAVVQALDFDGARVERERVVLGEPRPAQARPARGPETHLNDGI